MLPKVWLLREFDCPRIFQSNHEDTCALPLNQQYAVGWMMRGCSVHYHETLDLTESVDTKLIDPPKIPLRSYQDGIDELVSSVREKGLIQPIIVRPSGERFEVVAGARRLEACRRLRWSRVPCIIREFTDQEAYEISLTENIQRKTMNVIEEAMALANYIEHHGWGSETQLSKKIGKSQEYISQRLSLLSLPKSVQTKIIRRQINPSVAQEIARIGDPRVQRLLSEEVVKRHLTVGNIRESAKSIRRGGTIQRSVERSELATRASPDSKMGEEFENLADQSEPEFMRSLSTLDSDFETLSAVRDLEKAALILRLALSRLGSLIDEIPEQGPVKDLLLEKRLLIHNMIDSLIKTKIRIGGRVSATVSG